MAAAVDGDTIQVGARHLRRVTSTSPARTSRLVSTGGPAVTVDRWQRTRQRLDDPGRPRWVRRGLHGAERGRRTGAAPSRPSVKEPLIRGNRFVGNKSGYGYFAAAILIQTGAPTIDRNWFSDNSCGGDEQSGASIVYSWNPTEAVVTNNVFADNPCGAAVHARPARCDLGPDRRQQHDRRQLRIGHRRSGGGASSVRNNIVTDARDAASTLGSVGRTSTGFDQQPRVRATSTNYSGVADQTGSNGNITADPAVHRSSIGTRPPAARRSSPAVDAGTGRRARPRSDFDGIGPAARRAGCRCRSPSSTSGPSSATARSRHPCPRPGILDTGWSGDGVSLYPSRVRHRPRPLRRRCHLRRLLQGDRRQRPDAGHQAHLDRRGRARVGLGRLRAARLRAGRPGHQLPDPRRARSGLRITVVGEHYRDTARLGVARLRSDGSYDPAFSTDGRALYKVFPTEHDVVSAFRADVLTGGKIGARGRGASTTTRGGELRVHRPRRCSASTPSGTLDKTFSGDGVAVVPTSWSDIRWLPNGRVVRRRAGVGQPPGAQAACRRGQLDPTLLRRRHRDRRPAVPHRGANLGHRSRAAARSLMCVKPSGTLDRRSPCTGSPPRARFDPDLLRRRQDQLGHRRARARELQRRTSTRRGASRGLATGGGRGPTNARLRALHAELERRCPDPSFNGDGAATVTLPCERRPERRVAERQPAVRRPTSSGDVNVGIVGVRSDESCRSSTRSCTDAAGRSSGGGPLGRWWRRGCRPG